MHILHLLNHFGKTVQKTKTSISTRSNALKSKKLKPNAIFHPSVIVSIVMEEMTETTGSRD